ncbi:MAG: hypothetical protein INR69_14935, partial [Mucilaginibacter polytrichastri]|nr:hypothetical protein [Mucilaginibacter polytrichastri]
LLLEFGEGDIAEGDANYDQAAIGLCLLTKISSEKFEDIRAAKAAMKTLALDFIGRLREDCRGRFERPDGADGPLLTEKVRFDGRVHYADIGPIDRLWYGKRISFVFRAPIALPYNPSRWT